MRSRLARHYEVNRRLNVGVVRTTLTLPADLVAYRRRRRIEGHQLQGYGRYDLPLLASYSRSGTNWVRYAIEWISGLPTPGQVRIHYGPDFVIDRAHQAHPVMDRHPSVILLLRDYRECLLRHHTEFWERVGDVTAFMENETVGQPPSWYVENLAAYDDFKGPKILVHYEDLVTNPDREIGRIGRFLGLDPARISEFNESADLRRRESVRSYTAKGHQSRSTTSGQLDHHARSLLDDRVRREFDDFYRTRYPELYDTYLQRYRCDT